MAGRPSRNISTSRPHRAKRNEVPRRISVSMLRLALVLYLYSSTSKATLESRGACGHWLASQFQFYLPTSIRDA